MTSNLPFANNAISVFMYEPFSFTISNTAPSSHALTTTITSGIPSSYLTLDGSRSAIFAAGSNGMQQGTEQFTVSKVDASTTILATSTNTVTTGPGRFRDNSGNSLVGSNYTFYAKEAITPIILKAPFTLASPVTSRPVLPPGLFFTDLSGSNVSITGTPSITSPQTNYLIIGRENGSSKTVSSTLPIVIRSERIQTNITGAGLISGMQIGTPVTPATLTAIGNGTFQYSWAPFPNGFFATDNSGTIKTSPFSPSDASKTLVIQGTPTLTTASNFISAGYSNGLTQSITIQRISPAPVITSIVDVTFRFGETVLFDTPPDLTRLIKNIALDLSSAIYFRAQTYFNGNVDMSSISNVSTLPTGLSLTFNGPDRAYLTGTPTVDVSSASYTIRATNKNGRSRDIAPTIAVINDKVTLTAPTDTCYNFVLSRNANLALTDYYPSPITLTATTTSGRNTVWSAPALSGTGLSLSASTGKTTTITGRPTAVTSLRNLRVTATSFDTSETAQYDASFAILNEVFTLNRPIVSERLFIQNRPITPFQMTASTLSENPIRTWSATGLIPGVTISAGGVISGTPTTAVTISPTFTMSTAYDTSGITPVWGFRSAPDVALVTLPNSPQTVPLTFSGVNFLNIPYSQTTDTSMGVSTSRAPWQGSNFTASFAGNYLQGDFSGIALLPKYRLGITGYAGTVSNIWPMDITVNNPPTFVRHILGIDVSAGESTSLKLVRNTGPSVALDSAFSYTYPANILEWSNANVPLDVLKSVQYGIHDMAENESVIVAVLGSNMIRTTDAGNTWYTIPSSNIQSIPDVGGYVSGPSYYPSNPLFGSITTDGSGNWVALANGSRGATLYNIVRTSSNNGVDWVDTQLSNFVDVNSNTKLFYNNSRYFVTAGAAATDPLLYASSSNPTSWTSPGLGAGDVINDVTFSNNTALAIGSNGSSSACYVSSNNGGNWVPTPSPITYAGSAQLNTARYAYGIWVVGGVDQSNRSVISVSTNNLLNWTEEPLGIDGNVTAITEDGSAWMWAEPNVGATRPWGSNGSIGGATTIWGSNVLPAVGAKRFLSTVVSNGTPSLTLRMLYDSVDFPFDSPTSTNYLFWQYIPIPTIRLEANSSRLVPDPPEEVYYVTTGLPDGLTLTPDVAGSFSATITGTSVTYSDAPYVVRVYAISANQFLVTELVLTMRTVLPTVYKQQTSAGAWTSLVRQYTEVNAATTARDSRATPAIEYRLGEFTSPEPPSVITASSNCLC